MGWRMNTKRPIMWEPDREALKGPSRANPALDYAEGWKIAEIGGKKEQSVAMAILRMLLCMFDGAKLQINRFCCDRRSQGSSLKLFVWSVTLRDAYQLRLGLAHY
ncbi:hypothetical protein H112_00466 [Trichophyton rubrum D6]|uniref:Uncharacterized protein n=1 Tax=Trichophyton rubrum CBS 288.86 TaxID=1215330 RepID=A0A022WFT4_TRIRU|nr:hypothetical protein H100_00465 [Trichophyton rubrum MR850]EZF46589.1 hypothetical protein H102_00465 [Trichophyton rubrum CBS 100081]EZF57232.1 hypothetical protein H103_00465 [Trichophyton rubrum CBS 288.86]EZF67837.1 hypothetical protein H104_00455 [Trichophyton rubrum CBS 289.86]EZF89178.1 hypothetical protein H110_00469 [Trichophyton rubrum MR1448]EZF99969.1 hypothetical protein H113_00470 [Trichophyton rubrum MR1459]EZG21553.1 hypothetical protein H107_00506 [Trichophyton rubrum CBS 